MRKEKPSRAALPRLPSSKPYSIPPECNNWSSCCLPGWGKPHATEPGPPVAPRNQPYPPKLGAPRLEMPVFGGAGLVLGPSCWCYPSDPPGFFPNPSLTPP